ncbi:MAG: sulfite exporter TauE/SafE family protein [Myxococcota bacterium]
MISALAAALVLGLATVPHCVGMCGPLAVHAGCGASRPRSAAYHLARLTSLLLLGGLSGAVGETVVLRLSPHLGQTLTAVAVALTLAFAAFRYRRREQKLVPAGSLLRGKRAMGASAAMGAVTPLLPCASVWSLLMLAVGTASPIGGAAVALCFFVPSAAAIHVAARGWFRFAGGRRGFALALALGAVVTALRPLETVRELCLAP